MNDPATRPRSDPTTLVLGGSGFLGTHVVATAVERARELRRDHGAAGALVHAASRSPQAAARFADDARLLRLHTLDALRAGAPEALCDELAPTHVVVCSALSKLSECAAYPALAQAINVDFPLRVARWCARSGARLLLVSTDLVFGAAPNTASGHREEDPVAPLSEYGRTKARGELALLAACPSALVVRLPLLYGCSGGRGLGASDGVLRQVAAGELPSCFTDELRTPLEVSNAAQALVELLHGEHCGRLHVAGPERISRHELALQTLVAHGASAAQAAQRIRAGSRRDAGMELERPADVSLDAARARACLRSELLGVREGLARSISFSFDRGRKRPTGV